MIFKVLWNFKSSIKYKSFRLAYSQIYKVIIYKYNLGPIYILIRYFFVITSKENKTGLGINIPTDITGFDQCALYVKTLIPNYAKNQNHKCT